jgi:hypothetical protein
VDEEQEEEQAVLTLEERERRTEARLVEQQAAVLADIRRLEAQGRPVTYVGVDVGKKVIVAAIRLAEKDA